MLLTKSGQFSRDAVHAEKQALDYESFLSERVSEARIHFPNYRRADCLAVIGLERELSAELRQNLDRANGRRQNLKVVGFDWLLDRQQRWRGRNRSGKATPCHLIYDVIDSNVNVRREREMMRMIAAVAI